jgi:hypothetical protein
LLGFFTWDTLTVQKVREVEVNVVNLSDCRSMLQLWSDVRQQLVAGKTPGVMVCVKQPDGSAKVFFMGDYEADPDEAVNASMSSAWEVKRRR